MLAWFRKMQSIIAPIMMGVFLGGLFSLFCQHCLIKLEQARPAVVADVHKDGHCGHMSSDKQEPAPPAKPCLGVCDCEDNSMLIADQHTIAISDFRDYAEIKVLISPETYRPDDAPGALAYVIGEPDKPDRACFTPLERNCVLLN